MTHIFRRGGALSHVVGAAAALGVTATGLALGAGAGVASAAPTEQISTSAGFERTIPVRSTGAGADYRPASLLIYDLGGNTLRGVRVAVDGSSLHGVAELDLPAGCTYTDSAHLRESCSLGDVPHGTGGLSVGVRALPAAKAGQHGRVAFTVTASNGAEDPAETRPSVGITVGDGADLAVTDLGRNMKVTPGTATPMPLQLTNVGSRDGKGIVVFLREGLGIGTVAGNYSNCVYTQYQGGQRGAQCTFPDTVIKPGERLQLADPFTVSTPAGAHVDEIQYGAGLAGDDWVGTPDGKRGTGGVLALVPAPSQKSHEYSYDPSQDIDTNNNLYYTRLDTGTVTDVAGVDTTVKAVVGKDTPMTFSVRNSGTTTISEPNKYLGGTVGVYLAFPDFVRVVKAPAGCRVAHAGPEGLSSYPRAKETLGYFCVRTTTLKPGGTTGFTFHVVPLKAVSGMYAGFVAQAIEDVMADTQNNIAHVTIDAATATATPSASPSTGAPTANAPSANGDQDGTQLAATGSGSATLWTAAGGAAVLAAGAATLMTLRRRDAARRG